MPQDLHKEYKMSDDQSNAPMTSTAAPRALDAFGFAAYMRSGFEAGDEEMVAAKFEKLGNRIEALETALRFYANPRMYQPHPHGSAFDRRADLYRMAERVLKDGE
jgi:hypothetical protein